MAKGNVINMVLINKLNRIISDVKMCVNITYGTNSNNLPTMSDEDIAEINDIRNRLKMFTQKMEMKSKQESYGIRT